WGRLRLPNGQVARSAFVELQRLQEEVRMARNIKVTLNGTLRFAEVRYFAHLITDSNPGGNEADVNDQPNNNPAIWFKNVALVTLYSLPNEDLLARSNGALVSCTKLGEASLCIIDIESIQSVVTMIPHSPPGDLGAGERYFLVEKTGMQIAHFGEENIDDDTD
ncbi:hypothetical protein EV363DRAFT_1183676, partial [Boletus edulis]